MQELDTSSQRSVRNTKATLQSLLDEAMDTLEIQSRDLSILTFLQQARFSPSDYDFVIEAGDILSRISRDERRSLYDSVDAYSQFSNYLVSTLYRVQAYERIPDQSLVDTFRRIRRSIRGRRSLRRRAQAAIWGSRSILSRSIELWRLRSSSGLLCP